MATAPALLKGYASLWDLFKETSLTEIEQQVVYQTANFENECNYCVPWHTFLSEKTQMNSHDVQALRKGGKLSDPKLEALRLFTQALIRTKGKISQADLDQFFEAEYNQQQALEVILGLAVKTMSHYTNSIAGTALDELVKKYKWEKPTIAAGKT